MRRGGETGWRPHAVVGIKYLLVAVGAAMLTTALHGGGMEPVAVGLRSSVGTAATPDNYPAWGPHHVSLTRKHLTRPVYGDLQGKATRWGFTIDDAIQAAIDMPQAAGVHIGTVAGDAESYTLFAPLFNPIIQDYHGVSPLAFHATDLEAGHLVAPTISDGFVISTRIRVGRSLKGLPFPPAASRAARRRVEQVVANALLGLKNQMKGRYYQYGDMSPADRARLVERHFLFNDPDPYMLASGLGRDWPDGRGLFYNQAGNILVWVNEEDHLRIISMQRGANAVKVFGTLVAVTAALEDLLQRAGHGFEKSPHLGYLTTCPTNLGTALRASMLVRLPLLGKLPDFKAKVEGLGLQARGAGGEHDTTFSGVFDVSNRRRLGYTEAQLVQTMMDGVAQLVGMEEALEAERRGT